MRILSALRPERYWTVLISQVALLLLASLMKEHPALYTLFVLSLLWIFGSVIATIWGSGFLRWLALLLGLIALVGGFLWLIPGMSDRAIMIGFIVCTFAFAAFILLAIASMAHSIFFTNQVTADLIVGSICIYVLIGMFFSFVFAGMDLIDPVSFNFGILAEPKIHEFREYLYFSYTTLTTLGYGDMLPHLPIARLLASFEAMIGPVYLAIMVARLVGMHISQSIRR